eukprot:TRINITY_DN2315_c0_g1_i1.p1 TRINITY_DN2315_c0_g1~~TRINITY_DN2315_c0_g1_i1.p1  ORF type:complete len:730 (-),score=126.18 TRINITY_DN2315_c0_g1_i1:72-2261(-)
MAPTLVFTTITLLLFTTYVLCDTPPQWTSTNLAGNSNFIEARARAGVAYDVAGNITRLFVWGGTSGRSLPNCTQGSIFQKYFNGITTKTYGCNGVKSGLKYYNKDMNIFTYDVTKDISQGTWQLGLGPINQTIFPWRDHPSSLFVNSQQVILFTGGFNFDIQYNLPSTWFHIFNLTSATYSALTSNSTYFVGSRTGASFVQFNDTTFYLYGGTNNAVVYKDRFNPFDPLVQITIDWNTLSYVAVAIQGAKNAPPATTLHATAFFKQSLYVFGGLIINATSFVNNGYGSPSNSCSVLNISTMEWKDLPCYGFTYRHLASAFVSFDNASIVVYGGVIGSSLLNDLFILNLTNLNWTQVDATYPASPLRLYGQSIPLPNNKVFMTGGITDAGYLQSQPGLLYTLPVPGPNITNNSIASNTALSTSQVTVTFPDFSPGNVVTPTDQCTGKAAPEEYLSVKFLTIQEISPTSAVVQAIDFEKAEYEIKANTSKELVDQTALFQYFHENNGINLSLDFSLNEQRRQINYGGDNFNVPGSTLKCGFVLSNWKFQNTINPLVVTLAVSTGAGPFERISYKKSKKEIVYSMYAQNGRFNATIAIATVGEYFDNLNFTGTPSVRSIGYGVNAVNKNRVLIELTFNNFKDGGLKYDPNFGVVFNSGGENSDKCNRSSGLSGAQKAGIIVACVVGGLVVLFLLVVGVGLALRSRIEKILWKSRMERAQDVNGLADTPQFVL